MSAEPYCRSGSPASPPMVYWADAELRHIVIGDKTHAVSEDLAVLIDCLIETGPEPVSVASLIFEMWVARGRDEPAEPEKNIRVKLCHLRTRINLPVENIWARGYRLRQPAGEYQPGRTYKGSDEVGNWHLLKVVREPMLLLRDAKTGEEMHIPLSGARLMGLTEAAGA